MPRDEQLGAWYAGRLLAEMDREAPRDKVMRYAVLGLLDGPRRPEPDDEDDDDEGEDNG